MVTKRQVTYESDTVPMQNSVYSSWLGTISILHQEQNHLHTTHCCTGCSAACHQYVSLATYVDNHRLAHTIQL